MALTSGTRLGPYEILAAIGAGGMGEVYRARDTKLNRDVAIKVLPDSFANDPERLARFQREAQVLAALNHPNIAHIHGLEEAALSGPAEAGHYRQQALVMELVEGEDLAQRIARGAIPFAEALPIARQIAEALEAAHEQGIIHRDLKPANIKVREDGTVKVLDFGLAKALGPAEAGHYASPGSVRLQPDATNSPTITSPAMMTGAGMILGTAAYMAPEQAKGRAVDKRADIWAFGCVLYEMLTGRRAFEGEDVTDTLAFIITKEPDWGALPDGTPAAVRRLLHRSLEKDRKRRLPDIADARIEIDEALAAPAGAVPIASPIPRARGRDRLARVVAQVLALIAAASLGSLGVYTLLKPTPVQVTRFQINPPETTSFASPLGAVAGANGGTISPDGTRLVFVALDASGKSLLWVRPLDSFAARPLTGTDGASFPFWSPDSRFIGFVVAGKLKKVDAAGGPPQTVCDLPAPARGATWGNNGIIFFGGVAIFQVSAEGGQPTPVTKLDEARKETSHRWPYFLPDGRHFLYLATAGSENIRGIYVGSIESGTVKRLVASDTNAVYAPPGSLLFTSEGTLLRQSFDPVRLELTGEATPVAEQVSRDIANGLGAFSASATGVLTFRVGGAGTTQFTWFDRAGRLLETVGPPGSYQHPALSPDEKRLAFSRTDQQAAGDIWLLDLARQTLSRFTFNPGSETNPIWSPDGLKVFYSSIQDGPRSIFEKNSGGTGSEQLLFKGPIAATSQMSPDGKFLLYFGPASPNDVFVLPMTGEAKPTPVVQTPFEEAEPQFSPDGRWIAYLSSETGRNEVYVQPFPPSGAKWQVSNSGGRQPMWRRDGKELFFVNDERKFYAVDIQAGSTFEYGTPHVLFDMRANVFAVRNSYVPSRDGQRFLVNMLLDTTASPINVIVNWTAGLEK